ncbi:MAG TPA: hypothetical protein VL443_11705 [Cyclobacteriaceae bacterium]|jgi:hypothetical protein|nr:hypothetical protein [Cyclobacteriaceae bacterium]
MKGVIIIMLAVLSNQSWAQTTYDNVKLETAADCKAADPIALEASTYLLSTPFKKDNTTRLKSLSFIIKWMSATPDYTFALDEVASEMMKGNDDLLGLYMAAMTKYCLENKASSKDQKLVKLNALTYVLNYCEDENNNLKMTKQLKKLSDAKAKGELESSL